MKPHSKCLVGWLIAGMVMWGCASHRISSQESYKKIKPLDVAPQTSATPNLIIRIDNVADEGKSRKNTVELFINDKPVAPSNKSDGPLRYYLYELPLASGVYEIKAIYRAKSFWEDKEYTITTKDGKVRVYPDRNTFLSITLDKKPNGKLKQKKNYFTENDQPVVAQKTQAAPAPVITQPEQRAQQRVDNIGEIQTFAINFVNQEKLNRNLNPQRRIEFPDSQKAIPSPKPAATNAVPTQPTPEERIARLPSSPEPVVERKELRDDQIALQINTIPVHADVIVNDEYLGQSPLVTYVNRHTNHVIQISKSGYKEKAKFIDHHEFGDQKIFFLIEKLEARK